MPTQVGLIVTGEQIRLMVQTVPQHRQSLWRRGMVQPKNLESEVVQNFGGCEGKVLK